MGEATRFSTCSAEAPGNGTKMFANVTSICGSSSRGVTSTEKMPISSAASASSGVSCFPRKRLASRPLKPSGSLTWMSPEPRQRA